MGKKSKRRGGGTKKKGGGGGSRGYSGQQQQDSATASAAPKAKEEAAAAPVPAEAEEAPPSRPPPADADTTEPTSATAQNSIQEEEAIPALPPGLAASLLFLAPPQEALAKKLCLELGQSHLFEHWPKPSSTPTPSSDAVTKIKCQFLDKLLKIDASYPAGGLSGYISNARDLLERSRKGENPLQGWKPSVPHGESFELGTDEFWKTEEEGLKEVGYCGFVLVAGGLGERLGYGDIKIGLPTELATETCYIQCYIETILAYQSKYAPADLSLPLCIMTSGDTNEKTVALLERNNYFGMDKENVTIVQQGDGVPALMDNEARIALDPDDRYKVLLKPHGHGDVHALLHAHGVAKGWQMKGVKWVVLFQDTNGLAFHTLPLALGVSSKLELIMNSIAVPRKAKQAIGAITKLENEEKKAEKTINVEYNQLDPLLRASGFPDGDVNDSKTGFSPFPGNINQLLFKLEPYVTILERTKGAMPEFVNPKYKDEAKTVFKKPTRLECMMQDFPTVLEGDEAKKAGFTSIPADICFSPVKNATADGAALQAKGTHPGVAASGEADQYAAQRKMLSSIGCQILEPEPETYNGVTIVPGPAVVLKPSFISYPGECKMKFSKPSEVKVTARSSLVVKGSGDLIIESLDLDGALVIECEEGAKGSIRDLTVKNKGWVQVPVQSSDDEVIAMRGYYLNKIETRTIVFKKDGSIEGDHTPDTTPTQRAAKANTVEPAASKESTGNGESQAEAVRAAPSMSEPAPEEAGEKQEACCTLQ